MAKTVSEEQAPENVTGNVQPIEPAETPSAPSTPVKSSALVPQPKEAENTVPVAQQEPGVPVVAKEEPAKAAPIEPSSMPQVPSRESQPSGNVEKSRQRRSRHSPVLTYEAYAPRVRMAAALLDELF